MATRGADGKVSHADLVRALRDKGFRVSPSTVTRWLSGSRVGSAALAAAVGDILGDRSGALLAGGYPQDALGPRVRASSAGRSREILIIAESEDDLAHLRGLSIDELLDMPSIRIELPTID